MKVAYCPIYRYTKLPPEHRFPMEKYDLLPQQLLYEGTLTEENFFEPTPISEEQILRTHSLAFWEKLKTGNLSRQEIRTMGFPFHELLVERAKVIAAGSLEAFYHAKKDGVALNIAGGTHHSYADRGEGFCLFNDFAIASNELLYRGDANQILIVDLDVHQGNGTAHIFKEEPRVFTFSMHGEHNYPLRKERSDKDVPLRDGIGDDEYLEILYKELPPVVEAVKPDVIFYLSGVDILATDKLGRLGVSKLGCKMRDEFVFKLCKSHEIPVVAAMGGGYSVQIGDIIDAHANTFRVASHIFT
ncbi:histone deacetylase [Paracrocinitomix mangrovi]|uniref:histone deacetylase family protein n=1 Tax=Paracrocinitomix mangrovi TaxID=2862509 RepID=UPI001C8E81A8|nr:histone deacetylase [Paracrocinitomix mangrovi]UKN02116.1 histone deacetylase [Paracrocinitomix mangrovi]